VEPYYLQRFLDLLVGYLTNQLAVVKPEDGEGKVIILGLTRLLQDKKKHRCLLCQQPFHSRDSITQYYRVLHINKGAFDRPFLCPKCR